MIWTSEMDAFFRENAVGKLWNETRDAFLERFGIELTRSQVKNRRCKLGVKCERVGGRFEKGHVPANKGKTWAELGISQESRKRMLSTCYRKGNMPHNAIDKPIGYERQTVDGYTMVKVAERPSRQDCNDNFRMKHHIVWEEANGRAVPASTMIVFADGDKANFDPDNLVAVPRSLWAIISSKHIPFSDRETLEAAMDVARLRSGTHAARKRAKERAERMKGKEGIWAKSRNSSRATG